MGERLAQGVGRSAWQPGDEHRHPDTPLGRVKLVASQGRHHGTGPARPGNAVGALASELVDVLAVLGFEPNLGILVVRTLGAVVRHEDEHRVVISPGGLEVGHQPANLKVHGLGHGGVDFHLSLLVQLVFFAQSLPLIGGAHANRRRVSRDHAQGSGALAALLAQHIPAVLVLAFVFVDKSFGCLDRHMVGLEAHVGKKRLVLRRVGFEVADHAVHKIGRRIELSWHHSWLAVLEPVHFGAMRQVALRRHPVVGAGIALDDGAVKAAAIGQVVGLRSHVPLAGDVGAVTAVLQQRGHGDHVGRHRALVTRLANVLARQGLAQVAHAVAVVVHPGQQHGTRGRT